ncbi:MAG: TlpA family protein disulfide reductase [Sphingobacteriales bacterium]
MKLKNSFRGSFLRFRKENSPNYQPPIDRRNYYAFGLLLLWLIVYLLTSKAHAQTVQPLKVGDRIPDITVHNIINYRAKSLKLSDFKGKLIILDFWGSWCSSCLKRFPLSDSLQREFNNNLQFLLVNSARTNDREPQIRNILKKFSSPGSEFGLPCAIYDTQLDRLFPHISFPHYVWIDGNGMVISINGSDELSRENIVNYFKFHKTPEYQKTDFDHDRPLYTVKELPLDHLEQYSIFLKGNIEGIGNGGMREINGVPRGIILHNRSLLQMYRTILPRLRPGLDETRIILEVSDSSKLSYMATKLTPHDWKRYNLYSYEIVVPAARVTHLYDDVLVDLNRYSAFNATIEKRRMFCWILEKMAGQDTLNSKGGGFLNALDDPAHPQLINGSVTILCNYLKKLGGKAIILDRTRYTANIDLRFSGPVRDMESIRQQLKRYGLVLYSGYQDIDMLVIKDK